jgi:TPR repeat protein
MVRKAAEQRNAKTQLVVGAFYAEGIVVVKNVVEAVKWYRKASEQGDASASEQAW